jgi:hypothetical protein
MSTRRSPGSPKSGGQATKRPRASQVEPSWAALRPVLVAFLLAADAFTVAALAIVRPDGWVAPLVPFSLALVGLVGLEAWSLAHRRDDD